ncbi:AEC family transporter [Asticcacaulis sp. 201]|uniref:AEC family transporter n=1 Tax=Asticcacaulis sp. 201 TaxID=3028787 RepID=UPI002915E7BF|nr:AEC family transporter [Asticcacaulis sp. 201]MDV6332708.1 AEC family transporter [Asticcacaulis sp. 201]
MLDTLGRVIIFFGFIGLGVLLVRFKRLTAQGLDGLSAYFYWLAFPCWLMVSFARLPHFSPALAGTLAAYAGGMIATAAIVIALTRVFKGRADESVAAGMAAFINNSAFLGIPITVNLFGQDVAQTGALVVAVDFLILFSLGCAGLAKASGKTFKDALLHTARNPTVIGALIGVILMLTGLHFPPAIESALDILGKSGPPVALVALGGMLALMPAADLVRPDATSVIAIAGKILLAPACVALVLWGLKADPMTFKVCVFLSATPTAVSVFIQTKMYGLWFHGAAKTVAQSTLISLFTLSALALLLTHG